MGSHLSIIRRMVHNEKWRYRIKFKDDVSISSKLEKGQRIEARYGGKKTYYPGVISMALGGEKYNILYDDGGAETNIDEALIRKMGSEMEKH